MNTDLARRAAAKALGSEPGPRSQAPRSLTEELARSAPLLVTMGCGEACPLVPGLRRADWPLEDPRGKPVERVRAIRDEVKTRVSKLLEDEGWARK